MKKVISILLILATCVSFAEAKTIKKFYGAEAAQSDVNPCFGPTNRVCAEIIIDDIITTGTGDNCKVTVKRYNSEGEISNITTYTTYADYETMKQELLQNIPANATVTVTDDDNEDVDF